MIARDRATRRGFLTAAGAAGLAAGRGLDMGTNSAVGEARAAAATSGVPFFGPHQAGIATPAQEHLRFASLDPVGDSVHDLRALLRRWSTAAARLAAGLPLGAMQTGEAPPLDTGEAAGLSAARLSVTFGLGPTVFERNGRDRFGLRGLRPAPLAGLPPFPTDALDPDLCGGDLAVQVCANHPQVAFHAMHALIRLAKPVAVARWSLTGFAGTSNSRAQATPRNLMGFKDGTNNISFEDRSALERFVWADEPASPAWMRGGTYMVVRRIQILLSRWDATRLSDQEATFGRHKLSGAPLGGRQEHEAVGLSVRSRGRLRIPVHAHIRLASPKDNAGERILRRGYSFANGVDPATAMDAGLLFICFQRDPRAQFIPMQRRLAAHDTLNHYIRHVGSAVFACPPGARPGGFVGEDLLP